MPISSPSRQAKEFLIRCIVEEAQREGAPLSDTERNMLYFSETHWTLPNISEIIEDFDRDYDPAEYERKISQLVRNFKTRVRKENPPELDNWNQAVRTLDSEDHYLLVMIHIADAPRRTRSSRQPLLVSILGGIAALVITFVVLFIARR